MTDEDQPADQSPRLQISLLNLLFCLTIAVLVIGYWNASRQLNKTQSELADLRRANGYLGETPSDHIAAIRSPSDQPLTYRVRVRVPDKPKFRVAYSSIWKKESLNPSWFAAIAVPPGDSLVIVRILEDPRDEKWKITTLVRSDRGTKRIATTLPDDQVAIFRSSHDSIGNGVGKQTTTVAKTECLRLLDERWLVGEGGLMLYGDRPPERDQIGIYAELQPDIGPLH